MANKKILQKAVSNLDKAKAPAKKADIDYVSKMGYRDDSPFNKRKSITINTPDGSIDMSNTGQPLIANGKYLPPYSGIHQFDTNEVIETKLDQAKKGGSKKYSKSLLATNRLFKKNPLFKKPKYKGKTYDPNAMYFEEGGSVEMELTPAQIQKYVDGGYVVEDISVPQLTQAQKGIIKNWQEPNVIDTDENTGYNAATGEINQDSRPGSIENNNWWLEHEKFHHLQNLAGGMSTSGIMGQRPNNTVASDQAMGNYYDRRNTELETETDAMIKADPNLQFIPRNKLQESTDGFIGANDLMYSNPSTVEGEARNYENYIRQGGKSIFPQKKQGGALLTKKVTCKKCGWEWDAADGGNDLTTCHKCGGQGLVHAQFGVLAKYIPKTANFLSKSLSAPNLLTNYLTTQTALANAYKMNPFARTLQEKNFIDKISFQSLFDDRNYYQMLNNTSYKDLLNSNLLQSNFMTRETANKAYEMPYLAEVNADLTPEGIPFNQMFQNIKSGVYDNLTEAERSKLNFAPIEGEFITAKDPRVKIYKKHWLKGYTPVNDFQKSAEDLMTQTFSKRAVPIREYPKDEAGYVIKNLEPKINVYEWNAPNKVIPGRSEEDVSHKISNLKKDLDIGFVGNVASTFFPSLAPQISLAKDHSMLVSPEGRLWDSNTRYWLARKYGQEPNINQVLPLEKYARDYGNLIYSTDDKSFDDSEKLLNYKKYFSNPWKKEKDGGSMDYELGDEIDEATMEKLKKLGYTFEMVK
jgi:hypothetical protein